MEIFRARVLKILTLALGFSLVVKDDEFRT
jgi:hypothetical protein